MRLDLASFGLAVVASEHSRFLAHVYSILQFAFWIEQFGCIVVHVFSSRFCMHTGISMSRGFTSLFYQNVDNGCGHLDTWIIGCIM